MRKLLAVLVVPALVSACTSIQPLGGHELAKSSSCGDVKVYSSAEAARAEGEIEEMCLISGNGIGSLSRTVAAAVEQSKAKACDCGADKVYLRGSGSEFLGPITVELVAFRYKPKP